MQARRSTEWTGWLGKIGRNAKKWQKKHRFFRCVRVQTPGGLIYYEMNYFRNDEDTQRLGTINLFAARGVCWFGQYTRNVEAALVICIPTSSRVWFLKGSCAEQITHLMSKLSNIIPQLKIEAQGKMEIPRKQRFLKLKADWKNRFFVALSNRQVLVFNNAGLEEYEATFSMTRYREVSRKKDETGRQYIVCVVNEKNSDDDLSSMKSADSSQTPHKKMPSVLSIPPISNEEHISIDTWYNLIRRAIAYVQGRQGLSASDLQLMSLMNQMENLDYRATSHAIYAVRKGIPVKMRHNLWCGFSGANRRASGILSRIERQQRRWQERATTSSKEEESQDENEKKRNDGGNTAQRLVNAFETYIAERTGVSMRSTSTVKSDEERRNHMESLVKFLIRNMNPDPDEEENISSDMEDAAFRVLVAIATDLMPRYFNGMNAFDIDTRILEKLAAERFPALTEHMRYIGLKWREPALIWFRTMFIHLPQTLGGRVWDVIMVEGGSVTLLRVAIAMIRLRREELLLLPNSPSSRDEAMRLLSTESFRDTKEENRRFFRYAFLDIDEYTAKRRIVNTESGENNKFSKKETKILEDSSNTDISDVADSNGGGESKKKKRAVVLERDVAAEIYWEVSKDTPLFRLLVNSMEFSRHVEMHRRDQWSRVNRRANGWRQSCEDLRVLANEVCILASKYCKYATDLAQILLELKSTAHKIPPGFCDERLLPTALIAQSVNDAIVSSQSKRKEEEEEEGCDVRTTTEYRERFLCVMERLYDITFQLHASICKASTEAVGVKKVQRMWQQELKHVADIAHTASLGREPELFYGDRKARSGESVKKSSSGNTATRIRRQSKTKTFSMNPQLRSDLHHLTSCDAADEDEDNSNLKKKSAVLKGSRRRPQEVVTSLSHALISATWNAISSCWACDNERYWICYFEKSFLLKHDSPLSHLSPHRKLRKILVHMRLKFRIVAEELVQRLQRVQSCVGEQIRSARRESSISTYSLSSLTSSSLSTSIDKVRIQDAIPRLFDALSKLSGHVDSTSSSSSSSSTSVDVSSNNKQRGGGDDVASSTAGGSDNSKSMTAASMVEKN